MSNVPESLITARRPVVYKNKFLIFNFPKNSSISLALCPQRIQGSKSQDFTKKILFPGKVFNFLSYNVLAANRAVWEDDLSRGTMIPGTQVPLLSNRIRLHKMSWKV
jgi:hypothetical protein